MAREERNQHWSCQLFSLSVFGWSVDLLMYEIMQDLHRQEELDVSGNNNKYDI